MADEKVTGVKMPDWLDREDLELTRQEWELSGVLSKVVEEKTGVVGLRLYDNSADMEKNRCSITAFIRRGDGHWVRIPYNDANSWDQAKSKAEAFKLPDAVS